MNQAKQAETESRIPSSLRFSASGCLGYGGWLLAGFERMFNRQRPERVNPYLVE